MRFPNITADYCNNSNDASTITLSSTSTQGNYFLEVNGTYRTTPTDNNAYS